MQVSAWMMFPSPPAAPLQSIALMHFLSPSLQLKPTSSLSPRKPRGNFAITRLYLVLWGWLTRQERKSTSKKHSALAAYPLKHFFFPPRTFLFVLGPDEAASFQVMRLNSQCDLSLLSCCDLTGCWQSLPIDQASNTWHLPWWTWDLTSHLHSTADSHLPYVRKLLPCWS